MVSLLLLLLLINYFFILFIINYLFICCLFEGAFFIVFVFVPVKTKINKIFVCVLF